MMFFIRLIKKLRQNQITMTKFLAFFKKTFLEYSKYVLWLLPIAVLLRIFETSLLYYAERANSIHLLILNIKGGFYDILIFSKWALVGSTIFALFYLLHKKTAVWITRIVFALITGVSVILIIYFVIAGLPLDSSILNYSIKDIYDIAAGSGTTAWWAYLCIVLFPAIYLFISSKNLPKIKYLSVILLIVMHLGWFIPNVKRSNFIVIKDYYTIVNKEHYWFQTLLGRMKQQQITLDGITEEEVLEFQSHFPELTFVNPQYPFLHKEDTPDRLSPFFKLSNKKPHIVIIVVEGLARTFSGKNTVYPSPTPYLNQLAREGLSWENCFSTSSRTFGVLPALLGSLPSGIGGFLSYQQNAPDAHTLTGILNHNGYTTSFFYGGPPYFDGMSGFLHQNGVRNFFNSDNYKDIKERNYLGLHDEIMFKEVVKTIHFSKSKPRLDIYLTLTSHDPFDFPNEQEYIKQYSNIIKKTNYAGTFSEKNMKALCSFLYVDNAIKELIKTYSKESGFENTIFIITGDHNFDVSLGVFEVTRVPFIIWSPMLAQSGSFPAVVSHRELTPSLLALLRQPYKLGTPENVAWLNTGLDTSTQFKSNNIIPQMSGNRELVHFFYKDYFADYDVQYAITQKEGQVVFEKSGPLSKELAGFINAYKKLDRYVMDKAMLLQSEQSIGERITLLDYTDSENAKQYFNKMAKTAPAAFEEETDVYILEGEFPLNLIEKIPLSSLYKTLEVEYEFDIKVEGTNRQLRVVTQISDAKEKSKYWNQGWIVKTGDFPTDRWFHYEFHQTYKSNNYNFKTGDIFSAYIWDIEPGLKIYIRNPKVKLTVHK